MGVSGSGKTTIGKLLAEKTGYAFFDADNFHPPENIAKMNAGIPLTDEDRVPWLQQINLFVIEKLQYQPLIFVCSALKEAYRNQLSQSITTHTRWVLLAGDYNTILNRLNYRADHYMPPSLLASQFAALELPEHALQIDITNSPMAMVASIMKTFSLQAI